MSNLKKKSRLILQPRDIRILNFLFSNKLATVNQINIAVFKNVGKSYAYLRLNKLKKAGYIISDATQYRGSIRRIYSLSKKGVNYLINYDGLETHYTQIRSDSRIHDLTLVDILQKLKDLDCMTKIIPENDLVGLVEYENLKPFSTFKALHSDGYCQLRSKKGILSVAVEYERSLKSKERITQKMMNYSYERDVDLVFCVADSERILKRLMLVDQDVYGEHTSKMYFSLTAGVLDTSKQIQFHHSTKNILTLS